MYVVEMVNARTLQTEYILGVYTDNQHAEYAGWVEEAVAPPAYAQGSVGLSLITLIRLSKMPSRTLSAMDNKDDIIVTIASWLVTLAILFYIYMIFSYGLQG
jgi:hypothetical protein